MTRPVAIAVLLATVSLQAALASTDVPEYDSAEVLFTRRIAPLLVEKCVACHGADRELIEGGIDLTSLSGALAGGDSEEPGIFVGDPEGSSIYLAAARGEDWFSAMPPKESEKLTQEQLGWLHEWIAAGAAWPDEARRREIDAAYADEWSAEDGVAVATSGGLSDAWTDRKYKLDGLWAYQPVAPVDLPVGLTRGDAIDFLIEDALPDGLAVAPGASRRELIRRATFDLTGLPPTPADVAAFLKDDRPDTVAFADVVDRLLDSTPYGERMAQHWLDVVRYADSSGFANDFERGNAWRYRDYVVRSFNDDKPYDRFIQEQIAGDEIAPDDPEGLIAVGFLRMGPWELTSMEVERIARQRFLDDVTNSVGETFLGHALQCARCHDHKFDPVPTQDYYGIQAVFASTHLAEREAEFLNIENRSGFNERRYLERTQAEYRRTGFELQQTLLANSDVWFEDRLSAADASERTQIAAWRVRWDDAVEKALDRGSQKPFDQARSSLIRKGVPESEFPPRFVGFGPREYGLAGVVGKGQQRIQWEFERYEPYALSVYNGHNRKPVKVLAPVRVPKDRTQGEPDPMCIRTSGDPFAEGATVSPGTLSVLDGQLTAEIPDGLDGRRTAFADWVADADNPLTTRVMANRIWLWHFGRAIAGNPNNFGSTGARPTHPRLLDHLATRFVDSGWSVKTLHREIMLSETYRRSTRHPAPESLADLDPYGSSYAAFSPRRLSAEELRDATLAATGELNTAVGGIPCRPEINFEVAMQPRQVMGTFASAWVPNPRPEQRHRRSLYVLKLRGLLHPMFDVFNSPGPDFSCERREASTVTPQVFSLFNSRDSYARSLALADRAWRDVSDTRLEDRDAAAVRRVFELVLSRRPTAAETRAVLTHWQTIEGGLPTTAAPQPPPPVKIQRVALEEKTGERFTFEEPLFAYEDFVPDLRPEDIDRHIRALGDVCLVLLNSNEFVYVY